VTGYNYSIFENLYLIWKHGAEELGGKIKGEVMAFAIVVTCHKETYHGSFSSVDSVVGPFSSKEEAEGYLDRHRKDIVPPSKEYEGKHNDGENYSPSIEEMVSPK